MKRKLLWLLNAGIDEVINEKPKKTIPGAPKKEGDVPTTHQAFHLAQQAQSLNDLNTLKTNFTQCPLHKTATHALLGKGINNPKVMCVVYMPNAESDKSGESFSGDSGALLSRMLKAIGLTQDTDTYCTYLSPWRAPGNRKLTDAEIAMVKPFLEREIELVQPTVLVLFGAELAKILLDVETLSKARHVWHSCQNIPTRVSLSLDTIKTTTQRQQAWEDLQEIQKKLA